MGHKSIRTENLYTHATDEGLSNIVTASQAVLGYKKNGEKEQALTKKEEAAELLKSLKDDKELLEALKDIIKGL